MQFSSESIWLCLMFADACGVEWPWRRMDLNFATEIQWFPNSFVHHSLGNYWMDRNLLRETAANESDFLCKKKHVWTISPHHSIQMVHFIRTRIVGEKKQTKTRNYLEALRARALLSTRNMRIDTASTKIHDFEKYSEKKCFLFQDKQRRNERLECALGCCHLNNKLQN